MIIVISYLLVSIYVCASLYPLTTHGIIPQRPTGISPSPRVKQEVLLLELVEKSKTWVAYTLTRYQLVVIKGKKRKE
ncbi:hypothetical protein F4811DRAFT_58365 [Daldinia bambusicola]|nr:hypothetical protein F4811DRAFT_58365 [Daldinia bambusicola]